MTLLALRQPPKVMAQVARLALFASASVATLVTLTILAALVGEALRFFMLVPPHEFLFGLQWSPQMAMREGQVGSSGAFGFLPLLNGTLLVTCIATFVAVPFGLLAAVYMAEYAGPHERRLLKPVFELLAGIPSIVFGFFAALRVAPAIRDAGQALGLATDSQSALAAGLVMGLMLLPNVAALSDDALRAVPRNLREGALALGLTRSETILGVLLPAARGNIMAALLLTLAKALGETMVVLMAAGLAANFTINPLEPVTTMTVQMATLLVGDQSFDSAKTLSVFALGLVLFLITLLLNTVALRLARSGVRYGP